MGQATLIEWAHHTRNPWRGCAKVDSGCLNCYAEVDMSVKLHGIKWGTEQQGGSRVVLAEDGWNELTRWNRRAEAAGERRRVFCASLADIFEDWRGPMLNHHGHAGFIDQPMESRWRWHSLPTDVDCLTGLGYRSMTMRDVRRRLFGVIDRCPGLDFLLLTKRPDRIRAEWPAVDIQTEQQANDRNERGECFRRNVWLGASVSNNDTAGKLDALIGCRDLAPVLWCSAEPLIGPLQFNLGGSVGMGRWVGREWLGLDWVVVGGESGHGARACDVQWIWPIVAQCRLGGVPAFVKQMGGNARDSRTRRGFPFTGGPMGWPEGTTFLHRPAATARDGIDLRHPKGGDPDEWPAALRVQEFPDVREKMALWSGGPRP